MNKKVSVGIISAFCASALLFGSFSVCAEKEADMAQSSVETIGYSNSTYGEYSKRFEQYKNAQQDIVLSGAGLGVGSSAKISTEPIYGEEGCVVFEEIGDNAVFEFAVPQSGIYELCFNYAGIKSRAMDIQIKIVVDGEVLWEDLSETELSRWWKDSKDEWQIDREGNEVTSEQTEVFGFKKQYASDDMGVEEGNYKFALDEGTHTLEIISVQEPFAIKEIVFTPPVEVKDYLQVKKDYGVYENYSGKPVVIQGEAAVEKNSPSLTAKSDSLSAAVVPQTPFKNVINYIGGGTWSSAGETIKWNFKVEESGLYDIGFHYKQTGVVNGSVYRDLKIDGTYPFAEAQEIKFVYDSGWQYNYITDSKGKRCSVYLEKGEHTLEMTAVLGPMAEYFKSLREIVEIIGDEYLKINMITGETPDPNRDYDLFDQIPTLENSFKYCVESMEKLGERMGGMYDKSSSQYITTIKGTTRILNQMMKTKYLAHTYKSDLYTQYCNLSSLLYEMLSMPLSIDEIRLSAPNSANPNYSTFLEELKYTVLSFVSSFSKDYNIVDKSEAKTTLKLWTTWGRDQTQILNSLIAESFTPSYDIDVDVQITGATLIQGMLTNNAPDIAIGVERTSPVNFALRGAVYNLSSFDDFGQVLGRFNKGAEEPYRYKDGCYALPDTQTFNIMYYRTDILESLNLTVPETWEQFIEATATIQRNNMNVYVPDIFSTLLMQSDIPMYNKDKTKNLLDSDDAINRFEMWTDFYTRYKVPVTADFYNRFRVGVMPLGIAPYTTYTTFSQTAPEIEGRWGIAMLPGTKTEDGTVSHISSGGGTGCVILKDSKNKDAAWTFLKWWTDSDTQYRYSKGVESLIGATGRVATSNKEAFSNYAWKVGDLNVLLEQWQYVNELPEVPGSYYMTRSVQQAHLAVVNGKSTPSDALVKWAAVANEEIDRKIKEYS